MKQLKFECPECGTEFTLTANQTKAKERIEALKKAGVDVSELFAMQSADGLEFIASKSCLLYTSPSPRDRTRSRMPSSA